MINTQFTSLSTLLKQSIIDPIILNWISLRKVIPWIIVASFTRVTNAFGLSDLKLDKVDKPVPSVINVFWFCEVVLLKIDEIVLYEFNVSNEFKPEIYNEPFTFIALSKLVNPLTFNEDNNVVLSFNVVKPPICNNVI